MTLLALLLMTATPNGTAEELLARAQSSFERFKYKDGLEALSNVLLDPKLTNTQRARAYLLMGVGRFSVADQSGAKEAFREAFALSPSLTLPPLTSPKIAALFEQLRPVVETPSPQPEPPPSPSLEPAPSRVEAPVYHPALSPARVDEPRPSDARRPFQRAVPGLVVAAVGLLAGAVGVGFGVAAADGAAAARAARFGSDTNTLNQQAQNSATTANVLFAVAGGLGGTGVVLAFALP